MTHKVGPKGQIVIAKDIREQLGIEAGWISLQQVVGDHVEIYFLPPAHRQSLHGSLAPYIKGQGPEDEDAWAEAREAAWRQAAQEQESPQSREQAS